MSQGAALPKPQMPDNVFQLADQKKEGPAQTHWWDKCCLTSLWRYEDPERKRKALVKKNGSYRLFVVGLGQHKGKFISDIFITIIDLAWPYLVIIFFIVYLIIFLVFAVFWWLMAYNNGDFDNVDKPDDQFCLTGVRSFPDAIMFSIDAQTTIGFGFAFPNAHCLTTVPLICLQVLVGLFLETVMFGSIFVKIARPKHRTNTILFSKQAVVNQESGKLVLQVRVGDLRRSHLIDSSISGMVIRRYSTQEGDTYPLYQFNCEFSAHGMSDQMFLLFPIILNHVIHKDSPFYDMSPVNMAAQKFEIVLYLTGTVESTGEMCQARTSFLPNEIVWGHRFKRIEHFNTGHGQWRVDFKDFHNVVPCQNTPHSARELDSLQEGNVDHSDKIKVEDSKEFLSFQNVIDPTSSDVIGTPSSYQIEQSESKL